MKDVGPEVFIGAVLGFVLFFGISSCTANEKIEKRLKQIEVHTGSKMVTITHLSNEIITEEEYNKRKKEEVK